LTHARVATAAKRLLIGNAEHFPYRAFTKPSCLDQSSEAKWDNQTIQGDGNFRASIMPMMDAFDAGQAAEHGGEVFWNDLCADPTKGAVNVPRGTSP